MSKASGIGDRLYLHGRDISGDVGSVQTLACPVTLLDVTGLDKAAMERIPALRDGRIAFTSYFNPAAGQQHDALKGLPSSDLVAMYFHGVTLGNPAAFLAAKQANYDGTRGNDGSLTFSTEAQGNGVPLLWGLQYTAGKVTHASATNGTGIDGGAQAAAVDILTISDEDPALVTTDGPHGLVTGDSVTVAGSDDANANDDWIVTVVSATTFTIDDLDRSEEDGNATGGTVTRTSTRAGMTAALNVFALTSGTVEPKMQHSENGSSWTDISGLAFTNTGTGAVPAGYVVRTAPDAIIRRFTRFVTGGTFTGAQVAAAARRHRVRMI